MSALIEQPVQDPQGGGQVTGQNSNPNPGNSLTQINAGPAALAMNMIYDAMTLYAYIIGLQAQQKELMVNAQCDAAQAQASETIKEGEAAYSAAKTGATWSMCMAGASVITMGVLQYGLNRGSNAEMQTVEKDTIPMNEMEKSFSEKPMNADIGEGANLKPASPGVTDLMRDFKRGEYKNAKILKKRWKLSSAKETKNIKQRESDTNEAIKRLKMTDDYDKWESRFLDRLDAKNQTALKSVQKQNTTANYSQMGSQTANAIGQGMNTIYQGYGQKEASLHRAAAGLWGVALQVFVMAIATADDGIKGATNAQAEEVRILEAIHKTNSVV